MNTNESIKRELLKPLKENNDVEEIGLNQTPNNVNNSQEAIAIISRYEKIIKIENTTVIGYTGKQKELLKKFKDIKKFLDNIRQSSLYILKILFISF